MSLLNYLRIAPQGTMRTIPYCMRTCFMRTTTSHRSYTLDAEITTQKDEQKFINKTTDELQNLKEKLDILEKTKEELESEIDSITSYFQNFEKFTTEQINIMRRKRKNKLTDN